MSLEEAILERVRHLSEAEQEKVLRFANQISSLGPTKRVPYRDRSREIKWVQENRDAYADKWVAVEGDRLVAADEDGLKVYNAAKAEGIESPFVVHVLPRDPLPFVMGWL